MTCIIGLDLSLTSTGVVVLRDGAMTHCGTITSTQRGVLRLAELADALEDTIDWTDEREAVSVWNRRAGEPHA
jgi:hypothetical protein